MKKVLFHLLLFIGATLHAQYNFTDQINVEATAVKSQGRTGTCWSFSTTSFMEAEAIRMGHSNVDFSEMFNVYNIYMDKANNYVSRQGKANFSEGSLAHDVLRVIDRYGIVPQSAYSALLNNDSVYNHQEMVSGLKGYLDGVIAARKPSDKWRTAFKGILNAYMGTPPETFKVFGKPYTAKRYAASLGIKAKNYVNLTSFTHEPFNQRFILNIPDNYSNQSFYNIPLDELVATVNHALAQGYSLAWDGDVSEKSFSRKEGIAVLPADLKSEYEEAPQTELVVTQELRQAAFEDYSTTDDHLMHIVGKATDQNGTTYYIIKNSWGAYGPYEGYLYMSEAYFKMKTVSVTLHKDAVPFAMPNP